MSTLLREIYEVSGCFSTATHTKMCKDLLRQLTKGKKKKGNLAEHFANALKANTVFSQVECPFIPATRGDNSGTNPVADVMRNSSPLTIGPHCFTFIQREIPHLRAKTLMEQDDKAWMDYVGCNEQRPILGEIKWKGDKNPFYAFIQLLTYLSEMATPNQIERSVKHKLFGEKLTAIAAFDLHIFLANFNDRGAKGDLIELTHELADMFKMRLKNDHPEVAGCLGDVLCLFGTIDEGASTFSNVGCHWVV